MQQRQRYQAVEKLRETLDEKYLWEVILLYAGESFKTYTGLPFTYEVRKVGMEIHKGVMDRPQGKQQESGVKFSAVGIEKHKEGGSCG